MQQLNLVVVFIEGLLSFFSPCILPILPVYLSILSNSNVDVLKNREDKFIKTALFKNTILFVLGISTTFFILGSSVNILSSFFSENKDYIMLIGGIIIVFMGLFYVDIIKSSLLSREKRMNIKVKEMNSLSAFVLLNFWATWCSPCRGELPEIEEIYNECGRNNDDIIVLGVAAPNLGREGSVEEIANFLSENNYTFPVVMDFGGELVYKYDISGFPTTFIINKEGEIVNKVVGAMDKETMKKMIESKK